MYSSIAWPADNPTRFRQIADALSVEQHLSMERWRRSDLWHNYTNTDLLVAPVPRMLSSTLHQACFSPAATDAPHSNGPENHAAFRPFFPARAAPR
ncbi:MAG: hypothetical protein CAPSK01_004727 [Candidatus Accumulibacter vicinus]|uniref:Uncharacterized protein n=1 Tax=Candidatus Accumulibacter vicinus TaxID=2954382 RepID=A0A084XTU4_9PROT|nr:MAG: hypothetical protein CAPSK01_004727 [Candidatus Accumulibacter vicinus]